MFHCLRFLDFAYPDGGCCIRLRAPTLDAFHMISLDLSACPTVSNVLFLFASGDRMDVEVRQPTPSHNDAAAAEKIKKKSKRRRRRSSIITAAIVVNVDPLDNQTNKPNTKPTGLLRHRQVSGVFHRNG